MVTKESSIERREHERFDVKSHTVVLNATTLGQLIDISRGGMAFSYLCKENEISDDFFELNILCSRDGFFLDNVPCKKVYDRAMAKGVPTLLAGVRRCGVQFGQLEPVQIKKLEHFVGVDRHL